MSILKPEQIVLKVYRWDDVGAPALTSSPGSASSVLKSCLVSGYGSKAGAGWTSPFQATDITVLQPEVNAKTNFYLRLSSDLNGELDARVYTNMVDANTGDLRLKNTYPFKYGKRSPFDKWIVIASSRHFWFFNESQNTKAGCYFFCGDMVSADNGVDCVYMQHTGGSSSTGNVYVGLGSNSTIEGSALCNDLVTTHRLTGSFDGTSVLSSLPVGSYLYISVRGYMYIAPAILCSARGGMTNNFDYVSFVGEPQPSTNAISFGSGSNNNTVYLLTS